MSPGHLIDETLLAELRSQLQYIAEQHFRGERAGHTLQPTAVANEVWVHLLEHEHLKFDNIAAFKSWAAIAVRHVLVDYARRRSAAKLGGGRTRVPLPDAPDSAGVVGPDLLALHEALKNLSAMHERSARVVEMRFFGGMTDREIAEQLGVTDRTVRNDWALARGWLRRALSEDDAEGERAAL